jgi:hypothetical protein
MQLFRFLALLPQNHPKRVQVVQQVLEVVVYLAQEAELQHLVVFLKLDSLQCLAQFIHENVFLL